MLIKYIAKPLFFHSLNVIIACLLCLLFDKRAKLYCRSTKIILIFRYGTLMMASTEDFSEHLLSFLRINPVKHNLTLVNPARIRLNGSSTEISDPTDNRPIRTVKLRTILFTTLIHSSTHLLRLTSISMTTTPHPTTPNPNTLPQIRAMATQTHRRLCTSRRRIPTKRTPLRSLC